MNNFDIFHAYSFLSIVRGPKVHMENGLPFPKLKDIIKRDGSDVESYSSQLANHLTVPLVEANAFR